MTYMIDEPLPNGSAELIKPKGHGSAPEVINERRFGEAARRSLALLDAVVDSAPIGLGFWDRELRLVGANDHLARITGIDPASRLTTSPPQLVRTSKDAPDLEQLWQAILDGSNPGCTIETTETAPNDAEKRHWWKEHFFPVRLEGRIVGIGTVVEDVTEQRRAERRVEATVQRFVDFADKMDDVLWLADSRKRRVLYVNRSFRNLFQMPEQALYDNYTTWRLAIHPEDRQRAIEVFDSTVRGPQELEYRITRPDGSERLIRDRRFPVGGAGTPLRGGIAEDVTEQRAEALRVLRQEQRFERVFNLTGASIFETDCTELRDRLLELRAAGVVDLRAYLRAHSGEAQRLVAGFRVLGVNRATLELFRLDDADELIRRAAEMYDEETAGGYVELFQAIWDGAERTRYFAAARTFDGRRMQIAVNATLPSPADTPFEVVISVTDVTDLKQIQLDLSTADRRKDEFLAVLAHELLNPLAAIRSAAQILRGHDRDANCRRIGDVLCRQSDQVVRLVDDLLDVSRVAQGKISLHLTVVDLRAVAAEVIDLHRGKSQARRQVLEMEVPGEPVAVEGDHARLVQCVSNLVHNAIKFTPEEGRVVVAVAREDQSAVVRVRDNGLGIPADQLSSVFDLYAQVDHRTQTMKGGLGIGLSVVKRLVEMQHGSLAVQSDGIGRGSEFRIRLPRVEAQPPAVADDAEIRLTGKSVLVVDDNADAAEMMSLLLRDLGCTVRTAFDGEAALHAVGDSAPDAVLLDISLPRMDGYEVASELRRKGYGGRLIALTGHAKHSDREAALAAGFDHHVVKPADIKLLSRLLQ